MKYALSTLTPRQRTNTLLLLASVGLAVANANGIDLISLNARATNTQSSATYTLHDSQLTHHVVPWDPPASFQNEIWDDYQLGGSVPLINQDNQAIGSISNIDYKFASQHYNGWFQLDPLQRQTTKFTLTAGSQDLEVSFRIQYQWQLVGSYPTESLDDSGSIFISGQDANSNRQMYMNGLFPPGWTLQSYYDIPAENYSSVVSFIGGINSGGGSTPVTNSASFDSIPRLRPSIPNPNEPGAFLPASLYTDAHFVLSAGDSVSFEIFRGIPSPGALALALPALLLSSRRRRG